MADDLELDFWLEPDSHIYTWRGSTVPACTQTLELARPPLDDIPRQVLKKATARGKDVHRSVELHAKDDLDRRALTAEVRCRFEQWLWFLKEYRVEIPRLDLKKIADPYLRAAFDDSKLLVEVPLVHPIYQFGVTPDIGFCYVQDEPSLVEVKATSAHNKATALQTAAQERTVNYLLSGIIPPIKHRYGVRLTGVGRPDVRRYDDQTDWSTYLSFLNVHNWRGLNL